MRESGFIKKYSSRSKIVWYKSIYSFNLFFILHDILLSMLLFIFVGIHKKIDR